MPDLVLAAIGGYLLGSIPFGLILTRLAGLGDIRAIGSGNIGATNVLRTGNRWLAALTLLLDGGKGAAAVLLTASYAIPYAVPVAALAVVVGHDFPIWLRFKGGKGVATTLGALLPVWPLGVVACVTWLLVAAIFRYSSLAALAAFLAAPITACVVGGPYAAVFPLALAILGFIRHAPNIRRLLNRTEPRIGTKKTA
jgi:acyl phosphate:glycerol-3-phosphate acyltransferase